MLQKENADTKTRNKADNNKARAILDVGMGQFVTILKYKAEWYGRQLIQIDRYTPSSQMCNHCKSVNPAVKDLSVREWLCPQCGTAHDRDYNAAKNILKEGLKQAANRKHK
jgi:putative transposase